MLNRPQLFCCHSTVATKVGTIVIAFVFAIQGALLIFTDYYTMFTSPVHFLIFVIPGMTMILAGLLGIYGVVYRKPEQLALLVIGLILEALFFGITAIISMLLQARPEEALVLLQPYRQTITEDETRFVLLFMTYFYMLLMVVCLGCFKNAHTCYRMLVEHNAKQEGRLVNEPPGNQPIADDINVVYVHQF
ncbi:hypothetical protein L596_024703 [Steinernema carpocapsae]|uniref:Tetraspanin n=1 Tax=Steinernema carpocapsae TaxID=34508 RepID=A0A4U5M5I8_STECR|nr:hypothetical protein L596_024703 [Steinernema carpocapsae]